MLACEKCMVTKPVLLLLHDRAFESMKLKNDQRYRNDHAIAQFNSSEHQQIVSKWVKETSDINAINAEGNTILHLAVASAKKNLVKWILSRQGIDIDARNEKGNSPLIVAIGLACTNKSNDELRNRLIEIIQELLKSGAKNVPDQKAILIKSALGSASLYGDLPIVKMLVKHGFNHNEGDVMSPLAYAEGVVKHRNEELIAYLKELGAQNSTTFVPGGML